MLLRTPAVPSIALVEARTFLPRFWASVWSQSLSEASLKSDTLKAKLRHIGAFYAMCDMRFGHGALDRALGEQRIYEVCAMVSDFFHSLSADDGIRAAGTRWETVKAFLLSHAEAHCGHAKAWLKLIRHLKSYGKIRNRNHGRVGAVRALPDVTLVDLREIAHPDSGRNPFLDARVRWRNWLIVNLLLYVGIRRGEMLLLEIDSLKKDVDLATGNIVYWLDVTNAEEEDARAHQPSIKTINSHRQVPVSHKLAELIECYVAEYRVRATREVRQSSSTGELQAQGGRETEDVNFLFTSEKSRALSVDTVTYIFRVFTSALSKLAHERFCSKSTGKRYISPHDLRHTCATTKYKQFMSVTPDREITLQRMRAYFGWSPKSTMPDLYAQTAIQDDLMTAWNASFDVGLQGLRWLARQSP